MIMTEDRILGVAVVGLGVGEQHARAFGSHPACRMRTLCDLDTTRAESLAAAFPGCGVSRHFEEVIGRSDVDIVSIASYDHMHAEQVCAALDAGKHVFVEKPICTKLEELRRIKAGWLASDGRLKLRSNLVLRGAPLYVWLRERLRDGHFGKIYAFDGDYLYGRLHKITHGWRRNIADYSVMEGGGIHLIDLLLWLTAARPTHVFARGNRICTEAANLPFNDFAAASLEFDSGLIARITANFGCVHRHQHVLRVFGTDATFLYDDQGPRLHASRDSDRRSEQLAYDPLPATKGVLIPEFVRSVLNNSSDQSETQSFFDGISVCVAADRSAATGNRERIDYV